MAPLLSMKCMSSRENIYSRKVGKSLHPNTGWRDFFIRSFFLTISVIVVMKYLLNRAIPGSHTTVTGVRSC